MAFPAFPGFRAPVPNSTNPMAQDAARTAQTINPFNNIPTPAARPPAPNAFNIFATNANQTTPTFVNPFNATAAAAAQSPFETSLSNNEPNRFASGFPLQNNGNSPFQAPKAIPVGNTTGAPVANPFFATAVPQPAGGPAPPPVWSNDTSAGNIAAAINPFQINPTAPLPNRFTIPQPTNNLFNPPAPRGSAWPNVPSTSATAVPVNPFATNAKTTTATIPVTGFSYPRNIFNLPNSAATTAPLANTTWSIPVSTSTNTTTANPSAINTNAGNTSPWPNLFATPKSTNNLFNPPSTTGLGTTAPLNPMWPNVTPNVPAAAPNNPFLGNTIAGGPIFGVPNALATPKTTANLFNPPSSVATTMPIINPQWNVPTSTAAPAVDTTVKTNQLFFPPPLTNVTSTNMTTTTPSTHTMVQSSTSANVPNIAVSPLTQNQGQNAQQTVTNLHQQFLAACLVDPYGNQGRKDPIVINPVPKLQATPVVSTSSSVLNTTTTVMTTSMTPAVIPIDTNTRKVPSSHKMMDLHFNLKPVSSSPSTVIEDVKTAASHPRPLRSAFTDEEESILLKQKKTSKLRLPSDFHQSSSESKPPSSLYPLKSLNDLETLNQMISKTSLSRDSSPAKSVREEPRTVDTSPVRKSESNSQTISPRETKTEIPLGRLPILTRDDYFMKPSISELKSLFDEHGHCFIKQFTVGHHRYGSVTFYGNIDLAGLNLDEIITIQRHEVIVCSDDDNKPAMGKELNVPARITLLGVYPIDRTTQKEITEVERIEAMNYQDYLRQMTEKFDGKFIHYEPDSGSWTFMVQHFTRYGLDEIVVESSIN